MGRSADLPCSQVLSQTLGWGLGRSYEGLLVEVLLCPFQMHFLTVWQLLDKSISNKDNWFIPSTPCVSVGRERPGCAQDQEQPGHGSMDLLAARFILQRQKFAWGLPFRAGMAAASEQHFVACPAVLRFPRTPSVTRIPSAWGHEEHKTGFSNWQFVFTVPQQNYCKDRKRRYLTAAKKPYRDIGEST